MNTIILILLIMCLSEKEDYKPWESSILVFILLVIGGLLLASAVIYMTK